METREPDELIDEDQTVVFLLELGRALHLAYQPAPIVEARVKRAAQAWGLQVEVFTLQSLIATEVVSGARRRVDFERLPFNPHWNLQRADAVVTLADTAAAGQLRVSEARAELDRILTSHSRYPEWLVFLAYGVYSAAVAARIGGAWLEMVVAFPIGVVAGVIHFGTLSSRRVDLQKSFLATFAGTFIALGLTWVLPPFDASRALFGGATLLVPAMVVTLGALELVSESVEAGLTRLTYGLLRFLLMGAGIVAAGKLWTLFLPLPAALEASPMPHAVTLAIVGGGGVALSVCMGARQRDVAWIAGAVLLAYGTQELTKLLVGGRGSPLISAFVLGVAGLLYGRRKGRLPATLINPGMIQLAPGFLGTQAILTLLGTAALGEEARIFDMLLVAVQLVMGLIFAAVVVPPSTSRRAIPSQ
jgi:uncharacterized membrane protein YjjP (DUF1212 family)